VSLVVSVKNGGKLYVMQKLERGEIITEKKRDKLTAVIKPDNNRPRHKFITYNSLRSRHVGFWWRSKQYIT
jgi:hypothetical protein